MTVSSIPAAAGDGGRGFRLLPTLRGLVAAAPGDGIKLATLVKLRWIACVAHAITIAAVVAALDATLPIVPMFVLLGVVAASNLVLPRFSPTHANAIAGAAIVFDVAILTALLSLSGGPSNPFTVLFLVHVMLAAVITSRAWTWGVVAASSIGFALLFVVHTPLPIELGGHHHHAGTGGFSAHLQGMWLAHTIAAITIALFVTSVSSALRAQREQQQQTTRLLGLAALAAGAAHEIGNPLGTIRIAAGELERELEDQDAADATLADIRLINEQVLRAKRVLDRLAEAAGELTGETVVPTTIDDIIEAMLDRIEGSRERIEASVSPTEDGDTEVVWPVGATAQALSQLLRNAVQASAPSETVSCRVSVGPESVSFEITDRGVGIDSASLRRVGDPFYTTREGDGMGLGVFVARSLLERLGGGLTIRSRRDVGTTVIATLPREVV